RPAEVAAGSADRTRRSLAPGWLSPARAQALRLVLGRTSSHTPFNRSIDSRPAVQLRVEDGSECCEGWDIPSRDGIRSIAEFLNERRRRTKTNSVSCVRERNRPAEGPISLQFLSISRKTASGLHSKPQSMLARRIRT